MGSLQDSEGFFDPMTPMHISHFVMIICVHAFFILAGGSLRGVSQFCVLGTSHSTWYLVDVHWENQLTKVVLLSFG